MLNHLHINNFAIVPELNLDIRRGFTAITGETGAGKSILVDALGLLLGDRSDAGWVRDGAQRAELTAAFCLQDNATALGWLEAAELSEQQDCLLRRTISSNGRSRAYINGTPVTLSQLQELGQLLVEIHGQNEHLRLTTTTEQFRLLDSSGNYAKELQAAGLAFADWSDVAQQLDELNRQSNLSVSDLEFLNFQLDELQQHELEPEKIESLQLEHDRLAAGDALQEALTAAVDRLDPENGISNAGINSQLNTILLQLQSFSDLDKDIGEACKMLQEAAVNCSEASQALFDARERVERNPGRFEQVANILSQLNELARKHRVRMDGLNSVREQLAKRIELASGAEQRRDELEANLANMLVAYRTASLQLHEKRSKHANKLSIRVIELMAELGMAGGRFVFSVNYAAESQPSLNGDDELKISISANPGIAPGPLNKIASGGELSRISLAIKVAASGHNQNLTQIFDEVDAGIGGETANAVGGLLRRLSKSGQALCVTHLAQVAVCADQQLRVQKASDDVSTQVNTNLLDTETRVDEIARMLSGKISKQSRAHAQELLAAAKT